MCLLLLAAAAQAAAPAYDFNGLNLYLDFDQAVAATEAQGGACVVKTQRRGEMENVIANCTFPHCNGQGGDGACEGQGQAQALLDTGAQPLTRVGLEASAVSGKLSQIAIVFDGDPDVVAADLQRKFGPPFSDTTGQSERSWSHSRRIHWKADGEIMGLIKEINTILLSADAAAVAAEPPGAGDTPGD